MNTEVREFMQYEQKALRTKPTAEQMPEITKKQSLLLNMAIGLAGEAGELLNAIKKHVYHGHELDLPFCRGEVGDGLWYLVGLAEELETTLENIAGQNIDKLLERYPHGFNSEASMKRVR